eukprot:TRINITY_DN5691_c0_g1_i1.p1 TRINITY_DN5691_c0_g1~~TRINITY_DN5691_c0_g1_i1.p1  ORF type:complete len:298 (+),score=56.81 TRINITY_DN5691_c0_g1_i1:61-894(+)
MPVLWQADTWETSWGECRDCVKEDKRKLCIVSDFDRTLTRGASTECHILVARSQVLSDCFRDDMKELDEASFLKPEERPSHLMGVEWWRQYNRILKKHEITDRHIKEAVVAHEEELMRPGVSDFHETCHVHNIPFVVISAGITNVVRWTFTKEHSHLPLPHIISNTLDDSSTSHPHDHPITSSTKHEAFFHAPDISSVVETADVTIVLGDRPADIHVLESHPRADHDVHRVLKIGIINDYSKLDLFKDAFDIVLDGHSPDAFRYIHDEVLLPLVGGK